jgi:large subunit ribosomal protein L10
MSKQIKEMIIRDYKVRMEGFNDAALLSLRGVNGIDTTKIRRLLREKKIKLAAVRNSLAKQAFKGTALSGFDALLEGPSVVCYGGASVVHVARELVKVLEEFPNVEIKGALLDGQLFKGKNGVKELSKYPTREEALGQTVGLLLGPARTLMGQVKGPGATVAGIIKSIESKLEKGEAIAKK